MTLSAKISALWDARPPFTIWTVVNICWYAIVLLQPGLDRKAFMRWFMELVPGRPVWGMAILLVVFTQLPHFLLTGYYWLLYHFEIPFFEQYRAADRRQPRFWSSSNEEKRKDYMELVLKSIYRFFWGRLSEITVFGLLLLQFYKEGRYEPAAVEKLIADTPDRPTFLLHLGVALIIFETFFYWGHRMQHAVPWLYQFHKLHHEFTQPFSLTAVWGHTIDLFLTNLPMVIPFMLFEWHIYTLIHLACIMFCHTYLDHSNYEFPWAFPFQMVPFSGWVKAHDFHHSKNTGNYGLYWRFWDWIMGTDATWRHYYLQKRDEELAASIKQVKTQ